ncbi:MAG: nuclear transport factor 2 family protein [Pseudomonadales bacterium]
MTIDELLAKQEIAELSGTYMRGLDRLQPELVRSVFHDDATTDYGFFQGSPDAFARMAYDALKDHLANHHMLGQINITLAGDDVAYGEVYFQAFHRLIEDGGERDLFISGRYVDRYEKRAGVWKIAFRSEINDWARTMDAADDFFRAQPAALRGARAPDDASCHPETLGRG